MLEPSGSAAPPTAANGRPTKFTPERLQQIKNLVERGLSREQIAETIGVTLGSLQVTCPRLGISLRRPRPSNGLPPQQSSDELTMPEHRAKFALRMQYRGQERNIELPLSQDLLGRLAIEAHFHNLSVGEMAAKVITDARDLLEEVVRIVMQVLVDEFGDRMTRDTREGQHDQVSGRRRT